MTKRRGRFFLLWQQRCQLLEHLRDSLGGQGAYQFGMSSAPIQTLNLVR